MNKTGYRGVQSDRERFQACCNLNHSRQLFLGRFATVEEAAAAFLQHWEKDHPEQLEKARRQEQLAKERVPRPVLLQVQQHLLIRSDKAKSGYKGVHQNKGRYEAGCTTSSCHHNTSAASAPRRRQPRHTCSTIKFTTSSRAPREDM